MPIQKLVLLLLLVATLGGSAIWYMKTQIIYEVSDEVYSVSAPVHSDDLVKEVEKSQSTREVGTKARAVQSGDSAAAAAITAEMTVIDGAADASYDDSALSSEFTTADANTLTNSYDN